jgi:short-subunit dehydrogenase
MKQNIIIVGASSGLGRKLAEMYASEGNRVGIIGRRENLLKEMEQEYPGLIISRTADIKDERTGDIIHGLFSELHPVSIFIIAASVIHFNMPLSPEAEMETVNINVQGYMHAVNIAWHYFMKNGSGQIVGVTSIAAARGNKRAPAYHASKAFQSMYLESLRIKASREKNKILITELVPGYIDTAMGKGDRLFWVTPVEKAAQLAKKAIEKKKARAFIPGKWRWIYFIQKILPSYIYERIVNGSWKLKSKT